MANPKYKVGDIIRPVGSDPSTKCEITEVRKDHGGTGIHRYYGKYISPDSGGSFGLYEDQCRKAIG